MEAYTGNDPWAIELYEGGEKPVRSKGVEPTVTGHLYIAVPAVSAKSLRVRASDRFGNVYEEQLDLKA